MCAAKTLPAPSNPFTLLHRPIKRALHLSRLGDFSSLTSVVIILLLGFILFKMYDLTFQDLFNGFMHFLW